MRIHQPGSTDPPDNAGAASPPRQRWPPNLDRHTPKTQLRPSAPPSTANTDHSFILALRLLSTWPECDADVSRGHLRAAYAGVDLHPGLPVLHELSFAASLEQIFWQVAAPAQSRPIQEVLDGEKMQYIKYNVIPQTDAPSFQNQAACCWKR